MGKASDDEMYRAYASDIKEAVREKMANGMSRKEALDASVKNLVGDLGIQDQYETVRRLAEAETPQGDSIARQAAAQTDVNSRRRKEKPGGTDATVRGRGKKAQRTVNDAAEDLEDILVKTHTTPFAALKRAIKAGNKEEAQRQADLLRRNFRTFVRDPQAAKLRTSEPGDNLYNQKVAERSLQRLEDRLTEMGYKTLITKARNKAVVEAPKPTSEAAAEEAAEKSRVEKGQAVIKDPQSWFSRKRDRHRWRPKGEQAVRDQMEAHGLVYREDLSQTDNEKVLIAGKKKKWSERREGFYDRVEHGTKSGNGLTERLRRRQGPIGNFVSVLSLMSTNVRILTVVGMLVGILFIPTGFFAFAGWAIAAAAMVVVSMLYTVFVNLVRAAASWFLAGINLVYTWFGGVMLKVSEWVIGWFVPATECTDLPGVTSTFCTGREVLAEGLVPASELDALKIKLLDPSKFQPTIESQPLVVAVAKYVGFDGFSMDWLWGGLSTRMQTWVEGSSVYAIVFWFAVPAVILGGLFYVKLIRPALRANGV